MEYDLLVLLLVMITEQCFSCLLNVDLIRTDLIKGSHIEVYSHRVSKHDFHFIYDTKFRVYVAILHLSGLSYNIFY